MEPLLDEQLVLGAEAQPCTLVVGVARGRGGGGPCGLGGQRVAVLRLERAQLELPELLLRDGKAGLDAGKRLALVRDGCLQLREPRELHLQQHDAARGLRTVLRIGGRRLLAAGAHRACRRRGRMQVRPHGFIVVQQPKAGVRVALARRLYDPDFFLAGKQRQRLEVKKDRTFARDCLGSTPRDAPGEDTAGVAASVRR